MNSSDPPPLTRDSVPARARRSAWRLGCLVVLGATGAALALLLLAWWWIARDALPPAGR